jgi:hypothetical protein
LILGAVLTLVFFLSQIRRKRLQIDYSIYWILVSIFLFIVSIFPDLVIGISQTLGFASPANFVFLSIIFLLMFKLFSNTFKLSRANQQITDLAQRLALLERDGPVQAAQDAEDVRDVPSARDAARDSTAQDVRGVRGAEGAEGTRGAAKDGPTQGASDTPGAG